MLQKSKLFLLNLVVLATGEVMIDKRPIAEAWGPDAAIETCFDNSPSLGSSLGATRRSDIAKLVDTNTITFNHYITSIRVCTQPTQTSSSLIQSVHLFLGINGVEDIELDVIGFEYGRCEKKPITGAIREIGVLLLDDKKVHKLWLISENENYSWGPASSKETMPRLTREVIRFDDPVVRPLGFYGSWKFSGMTSLGVITFSENCIPKDGVF